MPPDLATYELITRLMAQGYSMRKACSMADVPVSTFHRWRRMAEERGRLTDRRRVASGRKPVIELSEQEARALRALNLAKGSVDLAVEFFARSAECLPATREWILARLDAAAEAGRPPRWPESLRRAAHVTAEERAHFFGPRAAQAIRPSVATTLTWITPDGIERPLRPHDAWIFDDYSTNQPYYLEYEPGQYRACRQVLAGLDAATHAWLSVDLIGKERDAYTSADCANIILRTIEAHGTKPLLLVLEQGRWKANTLRGLEMENGARWGSIEDAGITLLYGYDPRHKREIESYFNRLQAWLAESSTDIGRRRGEMEREQAALCAVNAGSKDPRRVGFIPIDEAAAAHHAAMVQLNAHPRRRKALGEYVSADELMSRWGFTPRPLLPEERWLFFPIKMEATVRRGAVEVQRANIDPRGFVFRVNGVTDTFLGDGHRVYIAFDPSRLDLGCVVANRETGSRNREGYRLGQVILTAPYEGPVARFDLRPATQRSESWQHRTAAIKSARTEFRAILPHGKKGLRVAASVTREGTRHEIAHGPRVEPAVAAAISIPEPVIPLRESTPQSDRPAPPRAGPRRGGSHSSGITTPPVTNPAPNWRLEAKSAAAENTDDDPTTDWQRRAEAARLAAEAAAQLF